jgi:hypothetical protein
MNKYKIEPKTGTNNTTNVHINLLLFSKELFKISIREYINNPIEISVKICQSINPKEKSLSIIFVIFLLFDADVFSWK